jgi:hypothetical protein
MTRYLVRAVTFVTVILIGTTAWSGSSLTIVTETMMQAQGDESIFIGSVFGTDASTPLQFTSYVDPVALTFSFASVTGQTYQGMAFSLSLNGNYDTTLGQYEWSAVGQLGSQSWTNTGTAVWTGDDEPNSTTILDTFEYPPGSGHFYTISGSVNVDIGNDSTGLFTFLGPAKQIWTYSGGDHYNPRIGQFSWNVPNTPLGFLSGITGSVPVPNGGAGTSEMMIASIPEPSTLVVLVSALPLGFVYCWRRRKRSA